MKPNLTDFTFLGEIVTDLTVNVATETVIFNAADLVMGDVFVTNGSEKVNPVSINLDAKTETCTLIFAAQFAVGALLKLHVLGYTGELNDRLIGFYRSQYDAADGTKKYIGTTQFEACDARRAFPVSRSICILLQM